MRERRKERGKKGKRERRRGKKRKINVRARKRQKEKTAIKIISSLFVNMTYPISFISSREKEKEEKNLPRTLSDSMMLISSSEMGH